MRNLDLNTEFGLLYPEFGLNFDLARLISKFFHTKFELRRKNQDFKHEMTFNAKF